jgi:hypothetical protein
VKRLYAGVFQAFDKPRDVALSLFELFGWGLSDGVHLLQGQNDGLVGRAEGTYRGHLDGSLIVDCEPAG